MNDGFYAPEELLNFGFRHIGSNCKISRNAAFYMPTTISLGDNVTVKDYCIFVGDISIGSNTSIGVFSELHASSKGGIAKIVIGDFVNVSSKVAMFANSGSYSELISTDDGFEWLPYDGLISLANHCLIGTGVTFLPGAFLKEGVSIGAMSLVKSVCEPWSVYAGIPAKYVKPRVILQNRTEQNRTEQNRTA
jgi:galactoside O-acetyltransferase